MTEKSTNIDIDSLIDNFSIGTPLSLYGRTDYLVLTRYEFQRIIDHVTKITKRNNHDDDSFYDWV